MSKLLRKMSNEDAQDVLERVETIVKGVIPVDANYFIVMVAEDSDRTLFQTDLTLEDGIVVLQDLTDHMEDLLKNARKRKRKKT